MKKSVLNVREGFKPFDFPELFQYYEAQENVHWNHKKFDITKDVNDYRNVLTNDEKEIVSRILKSFAQTETYVSNYWSSIVAKYFKLHEIRMTAIKFADMESIHTNSYHYLNEVLELSDFKAFLDDEIVMTKLNKMINTLNEDKVLDLTKNKDLSKLALSLVLFSVCTEGISLYSSFMILLSFRKLQGNPLSSIGQIIVESNRDERLHSNFGCTLFNYLIAEKPELLTKSFKNKIYKGVKLAVKNEINFINQVFENKTLRALTKDEVINYIYYRANTKLEEIKLKPVFKVNQKLLESTSWFEMFCESSRTDFFSQQEVNYGNETNDNWND